MNNTQMTDQELSKKIYRNLFTDSQWELIYNFIGNALDDQLFDSNDVYMIRNKIEALLNWNLNLIMYSNLSKIKPSLRTKGNITGNFGKTKVKAGSSLSDLGMTTKENIHITTQSEYINRLYEAMESTNDPKLKSFCYHEIKMYLIKTNQW